LHLAGGGPTSCEEAKAMACSRITDLDQRIAELVGMRDALTQLVYTCDQPRDQRDCPILVDIETAVTAWSSVRSRHAN
jgi:MerR family transcriptional regulator, mercuric resistance operon regulatory protein